jgi:hypothetical protein
MKYTDKNKDKKISKKELFDTFKNICSYWFWNDFNIDIFL